VYSDDVVDSDDCVDRDHHDDGSNDVSNGRRHTPHSENGHTYGGN